MILSACKVPEDTFRYSRSAWTVTRQRRPRHVQKKENEIRAATHSFDRLNRLLAGWRRFSLSLSGNLKVETREWAGGSDEMLSSANWAELSHSNCDKNAAH